MATKTKALGTLSGKVLLFGGVYSNLQALEQLIEIAGKENIPPGNCICTGDIIGYCAQPEEVVKRFREWGANSILGNVEEQLISGAIDCGCDFRKGSKCDHLSRQWYPYAQNQLSEDSITWIRTLPNYISFRYANRKATVVHGSYSYISEFIFESTPWKKKEESFSRSKADMVIAGHSGLPFFQEKKEKLWINPGVIGMPANEGLPRVWCVILEKEIDPFFSFTSYTYDSEFAYQQMKKQNLPMEYANTLKTGFWDNMEILPEREKKLRGKKIFTKG
ncbi:metallophosphoesterase [Aquimarina sp. TRL1]|uniref:metallophosphoesterase family protein n=1 Tax=Aquimarina sp. (strain TRL1) TaxID=2736252 RepID=UPI00158EB579|nr:metallophosphoesterase family protein [Aquimarina sp. TRL1]QKX03983.1 metallophosphoesterase [Aquimarina sp. TRL1]